MKTPMTQADPPARHEPAEAPPEPIPATLLLTEWFLPDVGGSTILMDHTLKRWTGARIHVLTGYPTPDARGEESRFPTTRVSLKRYEFLRPRSLMMYIRLYWAATKLAFTFKPEVIHCGHVIPEAFMARWIRWLRGTPYLVYCHGEETSVAAKTSEAKRKLLPWLYNGAEAIVANSRNSRDVLLSVGVDPEKIHIVHPSVNPEDFAPGNRAPDGQLRLLTVGRLGARKGHIRVLEALAKLRDDYPGLHYDIAGNGPEKEHLLRATKELGLEDRVHFLGFVPDEELPALYRNCDIFISANRALEGGDFEGFGIVFLEASASGKPVIGGASGGTSDAVDHGRTGFLVDPENPDELCGTIRKLADSPELRAEMGATGRRWVEENFSWADYSARVLEITRSIAKKR